MGISRRAFLTGSVSGAVLILTACTTDKPAPTASPTSATPTPTPSPTATAPAGVAPAAFRRSDWASDPYALGSGSYLAPDSTDLDRQTLRGPLADRLFFAGEATASSYPGTVHGARASGFEVAETVMKTAEPGERIAVIGAGIAGATAARTLADRGYDVVVVEARDRIGGRIHSVDGDGWPFPVETGAAFLVGHASQALEVALGVDGVTTVPTTTVVEARTGSGAVSTLTEPFAAALATASSWASRQSAEVSASEAFSASGAGAVSAVPDDTGVSDAQRLAFLLDQLLPAQTGADAGDLSERDVPESAFPDSAQLVTGGFSSFVSDQLQGLDVLRGSNVVRIQYGDRGVGLRLATGESLSVDRAVATIPLGVLKKGSTEFAPELPSSYTAAIDALGVGTQESLWLRFDQAFWSTQATVWAVLDDTATYRFWLNLMPSTGAPILVALTGGSATTATADLSDDDAVSAAMASLAPYLDLVATPGTPGTDSPSPTDSGTPAG
ncbi:FAD-dependent oxidoreductase [Frigoribacterium sp. 2-23]|uniref:flavin monoamine oxidase family protein n=1 Tax=Frigoribacterium sp. 2-23 TaxID=3415006 RepID=UPI003C6F154A